MDLVLFTQLSNIIPVSQGINRTFQTLAIGVPKTAARSFSAKLDIQSWTKANNNFHSRYIN